MSASPRNNGYTPAPKPTRMTIDDVQQLAALFKGLIDGSPLKWCIIAAGISAVCDMVHLTWLAARFIFKF